MKVRARHAAAEGDGIRCRLCPNDCLVAPGRRGRCLGRENIGGKLYATSYGEMVSVVVDPIEKKPLYHYYPGEDILSVATYGCNLLCPFCQNCEISQRAAPTRYVSPESLVVHARRVGVFGVAFTYTEPLVWFEYLVDALPLLRAAGLRTVLVTNGMIKPEPLSELLPLVDAMNIDLKSIRPDFYRDYVRGDLETVLGTIRAARAACHVELTNLLIPGRNDTKEEVEELVDFAAGLGRDTVLHFSGYFPRHRATEPPTTVDQLERAAGAARERLDYVYLGNVAAGTRYRDTFCPACGTLQVDRAGFRGRVVGIRGHACSGCGRAADVVLPDESRP